MVSSDELVEIFEDIHIPGMPDEWWRDNDGGESASGYLPHIVRVFWQRGLFDLDEPLVNSIRFAAYELLNEALCLWQEHDMDGMQELPSLLRWAMDDAPESFWRRVEEVYENSEGRYDIRLFYQHNFNTGYAEVFVGTGWSYREPISFGFYIYDYDTPESVAEQINRHLPYYMEEVEA